jgi:hypothetical protein
MKRILCFVLILLSTMSVAQAPDTAPSGAASASHVAVLASEEIKGAPRVDHVRKVLQRVAAELNLVRKEMPHVMMMYVRRTDAETQHLPNVSITVEQRMTTGQARPLYHVWIVDDVRDVATVQGLVMVLNDNFGLKMEPLKVQKARDRVMRNLTSTIDYHTLADGR